MEVIESVPVHEDIKLGKPIRDKYIENYKVTLKNLGKHGVKCVCYNFMPVFDWLRTDLKTVEETDGSNSLSYNHEQLMKLDPKNLSLPGWDESYTKGQLNGLLEEYREITHEKLFENLVYFLKKIMPVCDETGINMAIHPDDPPWDMCGSHDQIRLAKNKTQEVLKSIYAFLLTFKHVPVIYYGDEIGLTHYDNINKEGGYIRTGARTPFQWNNKKNRGFSAIDNIYLPVNNYDIQSLESQIDNKNSLFYFIKELIKLRKIYKCLNAEGSINIVNTNYPLIYERYDENEKITICINPNNKEYVLRNYNDKKILLGINYKKDNHLILNYGGILIFSDK